MKHLLTLLLLFTVVFGYTQPVGSAPKIFTYSDVRYFLGQKKIFYNLFDENMWDNGIYPTNNAAMDSLAEFLMLRKNLVLEIGGHVANKGDSTFSVSYSLSLANSIKEDLQNKGIAADRLITRGFGSTQPLVKPGEDSSKNLNNRIELKIVDFIDPVLTYKTTRFFTGQKMVERGLLVDMEPTDKINSGPLDTLVKFMDKNPNLVIEIGVHNEKEQNPSLSFSITLKKAQAIESYLISKGVNEDKLVPKGYDNRFVLNRCAKGVKCTDAEQLENRRVEFKILATDAR